MLKSPHDKRNYLHLTLTNGMRVLIVEDLHCQKSAFSATLQVGHFDDHDDCHGLSHLLEHMLFLGNQKYPQANRFSDFLAAHNGAINASTGTEFSSYFFDVQHDYLDESLSHFVAMLSSPLLSENYIEKEIHSIDAEFKLKQKDDLRRLYQVHKETCNPAHPFSKFSVGNLQTFAGFNTEQLKNKLRAFHQEFYHPENLCLCMVSNLPLEKSHTLLRAHFNHWPKGIKNARAPLPPLYLKNQLGILIAISPLQNAQRLIITFALPGQGEFYHSKPLSIISNILGDEGNGGLLDYLKSRNWVTSLSAGGGIEGSNFKDFNINLQITDLGITVIPDIICTLFSYLKHIKNNEIEPWRIEEIASLNQLAWHFGEPIKPVDEALKLSHSLFEYPPELCLAGDYILDQPDLGLVGEMLALFTPNNMRLKLIHQGQATNKIAQWYDTPYQVYSIASEQIEQYMQVDEIEGLKLPQPNPYLNQVELIKKTDKHYAIPQRLIQQAGMELWFGQDDKFLQPKGDCFLTFDCAASTSGIEMATFKRLWVGLLNEQLNQKYYKANLAGMHFHLYPHQGGFSLQTNGFSAKQLEFCTHLLTQIVLADDFTSSFEQIKAKQHQSLCNTLLNKPINRLFTRLSVLLQQHNFAPIDMAEIMATASIRDVLQTKDALLDSFYVEGLMYGNWTIEDTQTVGVKLQQFRSEHNINSPVKKGLVDLRKLPSHVHYVDCQHSDDAVVLYFQGPSDGIRDTVLTILLEQLISTPFFNQMRTEKQLGYLVGSGYLPYNQHPGLAFYIQSPNKTAAELHTAIQQFLTEFAINIIRYEEIWSQLKSGVKRQLSENDAHLSMKSQRLWMAIGNKDFHFEYQKNMAEVINQLAFSDLLSFYQNLLLRSDFGELVLVSSDNSIVEPNQSHHIIKTITDFKNAAVYLP